MRAKLLSALRSLANAFLGRTGKPGRPDTATRMAMDADFRARGERATPKGELAPKVDPIDELMRIVGEREPEQPPRKNVLAFPRRRGR
jgi:hypothetical protein